MASKLSMKPALSSIARICIPGVVISRVVGALLNPILLAGPNAAQRLERNVERLDGICHPSRKQRLSKAVALWLLQAPDTEPETIVVDALPLPSWLVASLEQLDLHPEKQTPFFLGSGATEASEASFLQATAPSFPASPHHNTQGVR